MSSAKILATSSPILDGNQVTTSPDIFNKQDAKNDPGGNISSKFVFSLLIVMIGKLNFLTAIPFMYLKPLSDCHDIIELKLATNRCG